METFEIPQDGVEGKQDGAEAESECAGKKAAKEGERYGENVEELTEAEVIDVEEAEAERLLNSMSKDEL